MLKNIYFIEFQIQVYCMQHYTVNNSLPIDTTKKKREKQTDSLKGNAKMQILHKSYSIIAGITDQLSLRLITQQLHNSLQIYWNYIGKILILKTGSKYYLFTGPLISTNTFNKWDGKRVELIGLMGFVHYGKRDSKSQPLQVTNLTIKG